MKITSSPLKWAGGKRWIVPTLSDLYANYRTHRFVEPFCGGLSATLGVQPYAALAADTLVPLINFWQQLQRGLEIPAWPNTKDDFLRLRARFNEISKQPTVEAAALFYYLNRTGFNGLCRFNSKGGFNVPHGGGETGTNKLTPLADYRDTLAAVEFACADYKTTLARCSADDFIYADPPYDTEFTAYSPGGFSWADQVRLARLLADAPCPVVVSNQATDRIVRLYTDLGFSVSFRDVRRSIRSHTVEGGKTPARQAKEIVATKSVAVVCAEAA